MQTWNLLQPKYLQLLLQEILPSLYCLHMDINHFQALNVASLIPEANPAFCHIQYARTGHSGIFSHASDRKDGRKGLIVRGSQQYREQKFKVTHQTHPASRGDVLFYKTSVEHVVSSTTHKMLPVCSENFQLCYAHMRKNTRLSLHLCIASDEKLGRGLERGYYRSLQVAWLQK